MISYETYKILHIFTLFILLAGLGHILADGKWIQKRSFKITIGTFSFLAFVAGMGLIARLGIKHGEPFPNWILLKIVLWLIFNVALVGIFKVKQIKIKIGFGLICFISSFLAIFTAVTKSL